MMNLTRLTKALKSWKRIPELLTCLTTAEAPLSTIAAYLGFTKWIYPNRIKLRNGASIVVHSWDDLTTVWVVWFGGEYRIFDTDKVFLDLGANIGAFSSYICCSPDRTVFAVEPFPENVARLSHNLESKIKTGRCVVFARAVDWKERTLHMLSNSSIPSHSRTVTSDPFGETLEVPTVTIPHLVAQAGGSVDLMKIDIEGYEYELFEKIAVNDLIGVRRIALEYHGVDGHLKLVDLLSSHGFAVSQLKPRGCQGIIEFVRSP